MLLSSMQFKSFVWPHNPRVYSIDFDRSLALHKLPFGKAYIQNLGLSQRIMSGEGEFVGPNAYAQFKQLASLFYEESPGTLIHPLWQSVRAYFAKLSLTQEPRENFVGYRFTFWECGQEASVFSLAPPPKSTPSQDTQTNAPKDEVQALFYVVVAGDTLWQISRRYAIDLNLLLEKNPHIQNPNRIFPGDTLRVN